MATKLFQPPHGSPAWFHACIEKAQAAPMMEVTTLSPPLAKTMLNNNDGNRSTRASKLQQYASDMAGGRWSLNGEPLIVSRDGKLNDGQHRCLAVIEANTSVPVVIMFGIERETRLTVDQGGARSAGDFLGMEGVPNAAMSAAVARMVLAYERCDGKCLTNAAFITSADVRERVHGDPALAEAVTFGHTNGVYSRQFVAGSVVAFAYYVLSKADRDQAKTFLEQVCRGEGLKLRDPAHTLREKLGAEGRSRDRKVAMILKAWNFHRRNMCVSTNSLNATPPFPAII